MDIDVSSPQFQRAWARAVAQAWWDEDFRGAFESDCARILRDQGADIPEGARLSILDEPLASLYRRSMEAAPDPQGSLASAGIGRWTQPSGSAELGGGVMALAGISCCSSPPGCHSCGPPPPPCSCCGTAPCCAAWVAPYSGAPAQQGSAGQPRPEVTAESQPQPQGGGPQMQQACVVSAACAACSVTFAYASASQGGGQQPPQSGSAQLGGSPQGWFGMATSCYTASAACAGSR
jgi:hypothetical protein